MFEKVGRIPYAYPECTRIDVPARVQLCPRADAHTHTHTQQGPVRAREERGTRDRKRATPKEIPANRGQVNRVNPHLRQCGLGNGGVEAHSAPTEPREGLDGVHPALLSRHRKHVDAHPQGRRSPSRLLVKPSRVWVPLLYLPACSDGPFRDTNG
jgi:hypothetical protein